jgi:membrane protein
LIGPSAAEQIRSILSVVQHSGSFTGFAAVAGIAAIAFAATSAFSQLQFALNNAWNVKPDPDQSEIRSFFMKRLVSFGMILGIGFLMLVSLLLSTALAAFSDVLAGLFPSGFSAPLLLRLNGIVAMVLFAGLFTAMHRLLPDAEISWKDAAAGGIATALLFTVGKYLIGLYLRNSNVTNLYGAAGSLAVILLWTHYSSMAVLMGAEFTKVWSQYHGRSARPKPGATRIRLAKVSAK